MADNVAITAGSGTTIAADDISGVLYQRVKLIQGADGVNNGDVSSATPLPMRTAPKITAATSTLTRPADTTAYVITDLVANSTTAGSVTALTIPAARANDMPGRVTSCRLQKSTTSVTNATFRIHLFNTNPVASAPTNGDNGTFAPANKAGWIGALDVTIAQAFGDGAVGVGFPVLGSYIDFTPASGTQNIFALIEARNSYSPGNAEVFTLELVTE